MKNWFVNKESEFYRFGRNLKEFISIHKYSAGNSNKILIIIRLKVEFACLKSVSWLVLLEHPPWPTLNWSSSQTFAVGCTSWFGDLINILKFSLITNWKSKSRHMKGFHRTHHLLVLKDSSSIIHSSIFLVTFSSQFLPPSPFSPKIFPSTITAWAM